MFRPNYDSSKIAMSGFFKAVSAATSLEVFEQIVHVTMTTAAYALTLPNVSQSAGRTVVIYMKVNATPRVLTIQDQNESQNWNDILMRDPGGYIALFSDGDAWHRMNPLDASDMFEVVSANRTFTPSDHGRTFLVSADNKVMTLPDAAAENKGMRLTFVNAGSNAQVITIESDTSDFIAGSFTLASSIVSKDKTVNKDLINTKSSSIIGDHVTLVSDGVTGYYVVTSQGIWASE